MMMRSCFALSLMLASCGGGGGTLDGMTGDDAPPGDGMPPPARGFQIVSPEITIQAFEEITYCYYFRTPNTEPMAIKKWTSEMTSGSHHMILFTTGTLDKKPPGTVSATDCGLGSGVNVPNWTYAAQTSPAAMALPDDDGTGKPIAMEIAPDTAAFLQMHYFNPTPTPLKARVTVNAEALQANVAFTKTAAYVTYDASINIPAGAVNHVEDQKCGGPPADAKFWLMSTHTHKHAIKTEVFDGMDDRMIMSSTNWEHPVPEYFDGKTKPFFTLAAGNKLRYRCTYNNENGAIPVVAGESAATNEMCMATGYYFPATKPLICFNTDENGGTLGPF